jgi:hypothetical protein
MSNIRKRNDGPAGGSAPISVVCVTRRKLRGFSRFAFQTKRDMHEDEMEELVVGLIAVHNEFQRSLTLRNLPSSWT